MSIICPTITAYKKVSYGKQVKLVSGFAKRIHIDLMDGVFTPSKSPNISDIWLPRDVVVDLHVMYKNPNSIIDSLICLKPSLIIMHVESEADIPYLAAKLRSEQIKTGVALLPKTSVAETLYILPHIQHALIFAGKLGYQGGSADLEQLNKVTELKEANHYLEIGWDGGANNQNCQVISDSGIDVINIGSAIHQSKSPLASYKSLSHYI